MICNILLKSIDFDFDFGASAEVDIQKKKKKIVLLVSWPSCEYMFRDEDWHDNDGALNTISMTHPRLPIEHPSRFVENYSECQTLEPGIW